MIVTCVIIYVCDNTVFCDNRHGEDGVKYYDRLTQITTVTNGRMDRRVAIALARNELAGKQFRKC